MADSQDNSRIGPPLRRHVGAWETRYTGTRAQLLDAGVIGPADPLPGDPGQRKTYVAGPTADGVRNIVILARPSRRFTVLVPRTRADIDAAELRAEGMAPMRVAEIGGRLRLVWSGGGPV